MIVEDADAEFDALDQLLMFADVRSAAGRNLQPRARVAASNASILFVAAAFEESVRQLASAYIKLLANKSSIPESQIKAIKSGLWERSSQKLNNHQWGSKRFDEDGARREISILRDFCLDFTNVGLMVDSTVYHTRNLRTVELNTLFKRIGVVGIASSIGRSSDYRTFFSVSSVATAEGEFISFLNDFYDVRNDATHNLGAFRAKGTMDTRRFIAFFKLAIQRLARVLDEKLAALPEG